MDGGCFRYSICFFTCGTLLLLGAPLHDVKASSCPRVIIHKKVGDTVEFSSCLPTEGVTMAIWKYGVLQITDNDKIFPQNQFQGRLELNPTNFSLTVRRLTLQDSGDFSFVSEVDDNQRPSVSITLQVHDVEASSCARVIIHKKVGDTVEFSSCLPTEGVTSAIWKYGVLQITDNDTVYPQNQFQGRLELNPTNFSLTVRRLTLQDSGDFSFVSEVDDNQRPTVFITLQVHEPITKPQILTINSTWHTLTNSCTVFLECNAITDSSATYNWTVRNQTLSGPKLQYTIRAQDGDTKFTCISNNIVSEKSASKIVKCSNETQQEKGPVNLILILGVAAGGCLMIVIIVGIAVVFCHCKPSEPGSDSNDLTVYADITEVASEDNMSMKPCSVYETIDNRVNTVTPGPQTVYDKIQLSRVRKASVSPYQEIS